MKYITKTYILLLLTISAVSCEGFLEKYPEGAIPMKMTTVAETVQVDYGIFSCFKNPELYSGTFTLGQDLQSDLTYAFEGYGNTYGSIYRWDLLSTDPFVGKVYAGFMQVISRCNFLLDSAPAVLATLTTKSDIETVKKCMGDAYFARALSYAELLKVYSKAYPENQEQAKDVTTHPGMSLVLTFDDSKPVPMRASLYDSYQQVLSDLEKAADLLKLRALAADNPYFTTGTVNALFARVYLYMRNYEKAAEYATKVIDSKVYSLADARQRTHTAQYNDYRYMWLFDSSDEIIWKISSSYTDLVGPLGKIFLSYDYAGHYRADFAPCSWVEKLYTGNDYRYEAFFMPGMETIYGQTANLLRKYAGNPDFDAQAGSYLYTNMPKPFRLSEQYLIRAEAYYYLKNETGANKDLTTLRRARIEGYGSSSTGGQAMLKEIREERVRELLMEGFRLSDLKRYGEGFVRMPQKGSYNGPDRLNIKASHPMFTWPIPQHEIDAVPGMQGNESNK